jgi:D-apionolactonase
LSELSRFQLWHGRSEGPISARWLRAGPVRLLLEGADLRYLRVGPVEIVQRIYVAVRDEVWNTIPGEYADFQFDVAEDRFHIGFQARHRYRDIDFAWTGAVSGTPDGVIAYEMRGAAKAAFRFAKIGFNIHHPLPWSVGRPFRASSSGGEVSGSLPVLVYPQIIEGSRLGSIIPEAHQLTVWPADGFSVTFRFEGDRFEMQDHRNWTDANFKTYSTPSSVPWPRDAIPGEEFWQRVTVSFNGMPPTAKGDDEPRVDVGADTGHRLPQLGLGIAIDQEKLSPREQGLLRALRLDHLRLDLYLEDDDWRDQLHRARRQCVDLGVKIELALFLTGEVAERLDELRTELGRSPLPIARIFIFAEGRGFAVGRRSTPGQLVRQVRERLGSVLDGVAVVGGTNQFFAEVNRDHPEVGSLDGVVYSVNPQVHAADDRSLMENIQGQRDTVATARSFAPGRTIHISPITLIGRFGPFPGGPPEPGGLPGNVDVRQMSLFCAAWTVGSIKHLTEAEVASATYYETTGWRGILERDRGSPKPDHFLSLPGMVFPVYHIFAFLADRHGARAIEARSSDPAAVETFAFRTPAGIRLMVANLTSDVQRVAVGGLARKRVSVTPLDDRTARTAFDDPHALGSHSRVQAVNEDLVLELPPFAVAFISETRAAE